MSSTLATAYASLSSRPGSWTPELCRSRSELVAHKAQSDSRAEVRRMLAMCRGDVDMAIAMLRSMTETESARTESAQVADATGNSWPSWLALGWYMIDTCTKGGCDDMPYRRVTRVCSQDSGPVQQRRGCSDRSHQNRKLRKLCVNIEGYN